jgi:hypothetical protein
VISVVILQNNMDLVKVELCSSSEACVTSKVDGNEVIGIETERVRIYKKKRIKSQQQLQ